MTLSKRLLRRGFGWILGRRLPVTAGVLRPRGIRGRVTIHRDAWGIPSILAESDSDAWFALGFCHGQDRAFQLEFLLRASRGTLSEVFGERALGFDRLARRIGFHRAALAQVELLDADLRRDLESYAEGVRSGVREGSPRRAHEFVLLRSRPSEFTVPDVRAILNFMSFALASNWDSELTRLRVLDADGPDALRDLDPSRPPPERVPDPDPDPALARGLVGGDAGIASARGLVGGDAGIASARGLVGGDAGIASARGLVGGDAGIASARGLVGGDAGIASARGLVDRVAEDLALFARTVGTGGASNNWALASARTKDGVPLLAGDPHLPPDCPSPWYLAHVRAPGWRVAGASFVGAPAFLVGHDEHVAWSITAGLQDNTDLFLEELGPDGRSLRGPGGFREHPVIEERIRVRGKPDSIERVLVGPRGPILSPALDAGRYAVSMRATWLDPLPIRGFLGAHRATSTADLEARFRDWPALGVNLVSADREGRISRRLCGRVPRRRAGWGLLPLPGWIEGLGWEDEPVDFESMPVETNPDRGFVSSANEDPAPGSGEPYLGADWIDGFRAARIAEALGERSDWTLGDCQVLQLDLVSLPWRALRERVLAVPRGDPEVRRGLEMLERWDGVVSPLSSAATVYEEWLLEMIRRTMRARAPRSSAWLLGKGASPAAHRGVLSVRRTAHLVGLLRAGPPGWFERSWPEEIADALGEVVRGLARRHGDDPARWTWGSVRTLRFRHKLGRARLLGCIFDTARVSCGGDANTVAQAAVDPFDAGADPLFVASLRAVMKVGRWEESRFILPGGQSGNPCSPHYEDQLSLWAEGRGIPIAWSDAEAESTACATLRLEPAE